MLEFLSANIGTIITCAVLIAIVAAVIIKMRKDKKQGKGSCGCSCGCCPMSDECHKQ